MKYFGIVALIYSVLKLCLGEAREATRVSGMTVYMVTA